MTRKSQMYINIYAVTRHYGGPEEGGWWYNAGEPLASIPISEKSVNTLAKRQALVEEWKTKYSDHKYGDIYSVRGGVDVEVMIESNAAEPWPREVYYC